MLNKKIVAWALYDLANTAFTSPFVTIFWPLLVTSILGGNEFHMGITVAISILIFSLVVPVVGIISDKTNIRKPFIVIPTLIMVVIITFLPWTNLFWNLILAGIATILYNVSLTIYNTLLPRLASDEEMGKISGIGMATGFTGTLLSIIIAYLTLKYFSTDTIETITGINAVFPVVAIFFLVFSLPLLFIIKDEEKKQKVRISFTGIKKLFYDILFTLRNMLKIKGMLHFLVFYALFSNALAAIDIFFFLFSQKEIGMTLVGFMYMFMGQSFGACIGAVLFGKLADRYGAKKMLSISIILWVVVVMTFVLSKNLTIFWIAGLIGSIAFGGSFATSRTLFVFLAPENKIGEFFGYSQIVSKLAALLGPLLGGWLIVAYSYNISLLMVLFFLVLSFFYIIKTPDLRASSRDKSSVHI